MNKKTVIEQIIQYHKNIGFDVDGEGYLRSPEDNLIELFPNWDEIKNEVSNGSGGELKPDENGRIKYCAVHSSSALCVNSFALFKKNSHKLQLSSEYRNFDLAVFETKLDTKISKPNIDFYLENDDAVIGFESKFTEYYENNLNHCNINMDKYYKNDKLNYLPKWFMEIIGYYLNKNEKMNLDVAQLIKHCIGLIKWGLEVNKKPCIVYVYWEPTNYENIEICKKHHSEIFEFESLLRPHITELNYFIWSYEQFYKHLESKNFIDTNNILFDDIAKLRNRYNFEIKI